VSSSRDQQPETGSSLHLNQLWKTLSNKYFI
jgi:hypothetical protein